MFNLSNKELSEKPMPSGSGLTTEKRAALPPKPPPRLHKHRAHPQPWPEHPGEQSLVTTVGNGRAAEPQKAHKVVREDSAVKDATIRGDSGATQLFDAGARARGARITR